MTFGVWALAHPGNPILCGAVFGPVHEPFPADFIMGNPSFFQPVPAMYFIDIELLSLYKSVSLVFKAHYCNLVSFGEKGISERKLTS